MTRFLAVTGIGILWLSAGASGPPVSPVAYPGPPVFVTVEDPRWADIMEQRLEIERQQTEAEARRAEAEEHRRRVEAQTPRGRPGITSYSGLPVGNPLAGTTAQSCILSNGSTIQVSGGLSGNGCQK